MNASANIGILSLLAAGLCHAADPPCGCRFVSPPKTTGVTVQRQGVLLPDPPPGVVFQGDQLITKGQPAAKLVCWVNDGHGNQVPKAISVAATPSPQAVPCQAAGPLPEIEKKKKNMLDHRFMGASDATPLIWSPRQGSIRTDQWAADLNQHARQYRVEMLTDAGAKIVGTDIRPTD